MLERLRQRATQRVEVAQYAAIQLISLRRTYRERRDQNRFRELVDDPRLISLSETQVTAATSHARETLVVAGAGSGKTSLLIGRAKYLLESKRASGDQILMLAYNRDAAAELRARAAASGVDVDAFTFHAFGNSIIKVDGARTGVAFASGSELERFLAQRFEAMQDSKLADQLAVFFTRELVPVREFSEFNSLSEYANFVRNSIPLTLNGERVKSHGEWLIANYLCSQGVKYEYEPVYDEGSARDRHRPDFRIHTKSGPGIYIEYFGIARDGTTAPGISAASYASGMEWKQSVHATNNTSLISLHYYELAEGALHQRLAAELKKYRVELRPLSTEALLERANEIGYSSQFLKTIQQFLTHARAQQLSAEDLRSRAKGDSRSLAFLGVFEHLRETYVDELEARGLPDFTQLIQQAAAQIRSGKYPLQYKQLLVDEYQDISWDRQELIDALRHALPTLEVTYVGDDWQSIYRFSGSDISIMREASKPRMNRKRIDMGDTYRLPTSIAQTSREFILKNPAQLDKKVVSRAESATSGLIAVHWDTDRRTLKANLEAVIARIGAPAADPSASLRILARYTSNLPKPELVESMWEGPVAVSTVHAAKGLEADYVIVTDCYQDARGFPSTIEDDAVMRLVMPESEAFEHAEERRLFYVALTRARLECHLVSPVQSPSLFTLEMLQDDLGVHFGLDGRAVQTCPACASGVVLTSARTGGSYCSNSPLCDFFAPKCNECLAPMQFSSHSSVRFTCEDHPAASLDACPSCSWGALVVKEYHDKRTGGQSSFVSCHSWSRTRCPGKPRRDAGARTSYRRR